jgi:malate dehydrogenase (quinone)
MKQKYTEKPVDIALIGAGIMSATLGTLLQQLRPGSSMAVFERLSDIAAESSDAWNNAGTGHAAYCELNYTSLRPDGSVDCAKAFKINEQFEISKQFWAYLIEQELIEVPAGFIHAVPHLSFVQGAEDVDFLKKRHAALIQNQLFKGMKFSADQGQLQEWIPLMMTGRNSDVPVAATYMSTGTDVNFGALTRKMFQYLATQTDTEIQLQHEVLDLKRAEDGSYWEITVHDLTNDERYTIRANFVFIGAGGGALDLLNKSGIPEADGYGGFPVSGQWLRCTNEDVINRHHAKVYGKASVGTPPMSVPHLDTRIIDGKKELLFGPFAGFTTKFLKNGSYLDLLKAIDSDNLVPMLEAGLHNIPLTKYLIKQVLQSPEDRLNSLREFFPEARMEDWELKIAGQRVQVIRDDEAKGGVLEFGTEVVHSVDGSLAALMGASPGASTAVAIMLNVLESCFHKSMTTESWQKKMKEMIPSFGQHLSEDALLCARVKNRTSRILNIE